MKLTSMETNRHFKNVLVEQFGTKKIVHVDPVLIQVLVETPSIGILRLANVHASQYVVA